LTTSYMTYLLRKGKREGFQMARDWFISADSLEPFRSQP